MEGYSIERTGEALGLSASAASMRLSRARAILKTRLSRRGIVLSLESLVMVLVPGEEAGTLDPALASSIAKAAHLLACGGPGQDQTTKLVSPRALAMRQKALNLFLLARMVVVAKAAVLIMAISALGLGAYWAWGAEPAASPPPPRAQEARPDQAGGGQDKGHPDLPKARPSPGSFSSTDETGKREMVQKGTGPDLPPAFPPLPGSTSEGSKKSPRIPRSIPPVPASPQELAGDLRRLLDGSLPPEMFSMDACFIYPRMIITDGGIGKTIGKLGEPGRDFTIYIKGHKLEINFSVIVGHRKENTLLGWIGIPEYDAVKAQRILSNPGFQEFLRLMLDVDWGNARQALGVEGGPVQIDFMTGEKNFKNTRGFSYLHPIPPVQLPFEILSLRKKCEEYFQWACSARKKP